VQVLGAGAGARATVMVGALDNREARRHVNHLAWWSGTPWVDGAIGELDGSVRVFHPPVSCYECTLDDADFEIIARRRSCRLLGTDAPATGVVPTSITTASVVAGIQAQEVVKLLHQQAGHLPPPDDPENGFRFYGLHNVCYSEISPTKSDCMAHELRPEVIEHHGPVASLAEVAAVAGVVEGVVELGDDHVLSWTCPRCETEQTDGRPVWRLGPRDAICPTCTTLRRAELRTSVEVPSDIAEWPMERWQRRRDDHIAVRQGMDRRIIWLRDDAAYPEGW
jgi:adenylyltransferase/sulfurtransferase